MDKRIRQIIFQTKIWSIAALISPTIALFVFICLIYFDLTNHIALFSIIVGMIFFSAASYWWWWTMYQVYRFSKNYNDVDNHIKEVKKEVRELREELNNT